MNTEQYNDNLNYKVNALKDEPAEIIKNTLQLPLLSTEETNDLIKKAQAGDIEARNKIIEHNMKLIYKYATKYAPMSQHVEVSDLVSAGCIGMIRAIEKFKFDMGTKFSTYAVPWVKQAMTRTISKDDTTIRLPVYLREIKHTLNKAIVDYINIYQKKPSNEELLDFLIKNNYKMRDNNLGTWTLEKLYDLLLLSNYDSPASLNVIVGDDKDKSEEELLDFMINPDNTPEEQYLKGDRLNYILKIIKKYVPKKRDRRMIYNKYGFNPTNTPMTLDQIGAQEGITRERVRQIIASNLEKIRKSGKLDIYKDDL